MQLQPSLLRGKRTLIVGDAATGKTRLTAWLLHAFLEQYPEERGVLIDMAPPAFPVDGGRLGGRLCDLNPLPGRVHLLLPGAVRAPRLQGRTASEVLELAEANRRVIEPLLERYLKGPAPLLVINDLTIYLHAGTVRRLMEVIGRADTFLGNAYYGRFLHDDRGSGVSRREREAVEELMGHMDYVIHLPPRGDAQKMAARRRVEGG